jgi:hypothetical protein
MKSMDLQFYTQKKCNDRRKSPGEATLTHMKYTTEVQKINYARSSKLANLV